MKAFLIYGEIGAYANYYLFVGTREKAVLWAQNMHLANWEVTDFTAEAFSWRFEEQGNVVMLGPV
jgi:hypothetical protein